MQLKLEQDWNELAGAHSKESPVNLVPRMRTLLEVALKDHYRTSGVEWPQDLASAISKFIEGNGLDRNLRFSLHEIRVKANQVLHEGFRPVAGDVRKGLHTLKSLLRITHGLTLAMPVPASPSASASEHTDNPTPASPEGGTRTEDFPRPSEILEASPPGGRVERLVRLMGLDLPGGVLVVQEIQKDGAPGGPSVQVKPSPRFTDLLIPEMMYRLVNLIDETIDENGISHPRLIVLEPDYLVNVTQVSECLQNSGPQPFVALLEAFVPRESSRAQFLGNIVNHLLDREIEAAAHNLNFDLDEFIRNDLFQLDPLIWSTLQEFQQPDGPRELIGELRKHHATIHHARKQGFITQDPRYSQRPRIDHRAASLEPSFLSARYGLQGRLDLLHQSLDGYDVVELKSAKSFPGYSRKVWGNHEAQGLLYRLLLERAAPTKQASSGQISILYSAAKPDEAPLRHVLTVPDTIEKVVSTRNRIVLTELLIGESPSPSRTHALLEPIMEGKDNLGLKGFLTSHSQWVASAWLGADPVESAWAHEYTRFIAKEMRLSLLGRPEALGAPGNQASTWRAPDRAKKVAGTLLDDMTADPRDPKAPSKLKLRYSAPIDGVEDGGANFREGDSLLLYPRRRKGAIATTKLGALESQVLKVSLESFQEDGVTVNFINRLVSPSFFEDHDLWALEPSIYDNSRQEWAGLSAILALPEDQRRLLLGRTPPLRPLVETPNDLDPVDAALAAPNYFLLCGPPGTGKTSNALKRMVEELVKSGKTLLLAAYTRRAVDEICATLEGLGGGSQFDYLRLTAPLYTDPAYHGHLLDNRLAGCKSRKQVRDQIQQCRIFVGTVAGLIRNTELFQLKEFDVAIIDEASQILEVPTLMLVSKVRKFILIGDHKQLPAVVQQNREESTVSPEVADLMGRELGLFNLRNSYFERIYGLAQANWPWACGTLKIQYRMHQDILELVNHRYYDGVLSCGQDRQLREDLGRDLWPASRSKLGDWIRKRRVMFFSAERSGEDVSSKENHQEARLAVKFIMELAEGYGSTFDPARTVGVIASYRNQVALIRRNLEHLAAEHNIPGLTKITVDTVERFQGSQRDVIIYSFCCAFDWQLEQLVAESVGSVDGKSVDRKLNVALTRAREQLILIGDPKVLGKASGYAGILADIRAKGGMPEAAENNF